MNTSREQHEDSFPHGLFSFLLIAGIIICAFNIGVTFHRDISQANEKRRISTKNVLSTLSQARQSVSEEGKFIRLQSDSLPDDAYGKRLRVEYYPGGTTEIVAVTSAGPDGEFDTEDDLRAEATLLNFQGAGKAATAGAKTLAKNIIEGIKEGATQ